MSAPHFFWGYERQVVMEVHRDDVHGFGRDPQVEKFKEDLAAHIRFRDGSDHHDGAEYDHLKRFRKKLNGASTIESNPKCLDELLGLQGAKGRAHAERSCAQGTAHDWRVVGAIRHHSVETACTQYRADAQYEVSILGSMLGKPTRGSMIALKRVTRYLKGTRDFVNKLELDNEVDKRVARLDGFSDSDWAGSTDRKSQSSSAL